MATYIFVSGAWHAGWCWERVAPLLQAAGHTAIAPDLLGMGADRTPLSSVSLAAWADQIAQLIRSVDEQVILVGHSRGGVVISEAAERVPDQIRTLVYVTAFLVPSGQSLATMAAQAPESQLAANLTFSEDGSTTVNPDAVGAIFYNQTDEAWLERAKARLCPEPVAALVTPLQLTDEHFGRVRRAYIECSDDKIIPLSLQRSMQNALPCEPVFTIATDHSPFYSAPEELAACLLKLAP